MTLLALHLALAEDPSLAPAPELLASAPAAAPRWEIGRRLSDVLDPEGKLLLPPGKAVLLRIDPPEASVEVRQVPLLSEEGDSADSPEPVRTAHLDVVGVADGLVVPAAGTSRRLEVDVPEKCRVFVHYSEGVRESAWLQWYWDAEAAIRRGRPVPTPPDRGVAVAAEITLRTRAVADIEVARLGLAHDIDSIGSITPLSHVVGAELPLAPDEPMAVLGPAVVTLRVAPPRGRLQRYTVVTTLDGRELGRTPMASTGAVPLPLRVWVPPGRHTLSALAPELPLTLTSELAVRRGGVLHPLPRVRAPEGIAAAEIAWLSGDLAEARAGFSAYVEEDSAAGELARARMLASSVEPEEAIRLSDPSRARSVEGREVLANATLRASRLLPDERVLAAAHQAADPDLLSLAEWLDESGQFRPRGVALLSLASPPVPVARPSAPMAVRRAALATRLSLLEPDSSAGPADRRTTHTPPGTPRLDAVPGFPVQIQAQEVVPGRVPVVRLRAIEPSTFEVDGVPWVATSPGDLDVGVLVGPHTISVSSGRVRIRDPEGATGGEALYEWAAWPTPATWPVPDEGVPAELAVTVEGAGRWTVDLGDGRVETFEVVVSAAQIRLEVGPNAGTITVHGPEGGRAAVAMRVIRARPGPSALVVPLDRASATAAIESATRAIDAGDASARVLRAGVLAAWGQLSEARNDLAWATSSGDVLLANQIERLIAVQLPSSAAPGPRTIAAALAAARYAGPPPTDAAEFERLGGELSQPWLYVEAANRRVNEGNTPAALEDARLAGAFGDELYASILARIRWQRISFPDSSAGMSKERRLPTVPSEEPLWREVRTALFAAPWPSQQSVVLRGDAVHLAAFSGKSWKAEVFCRDETRMGAKCTVPFAMDGVARSQVIADGQTWERSSEGQTIRAHALEVGPAAPGNALAVRLTVDGEVRLPQTVVEAVRATRARPIELAVRAPTVLRVEVLDGEVEVRGQRARAGEPPLILPLREPGTSLVQVVGDAAVVFAVGTASPSPRRPPAEGIAVPPLPARVPVAEVRGLLGDVIAEPSFPQGAPRDGGSWTAGITALHRQLRGATEPWNALELRGEWARVASVRWFQAEAWARGPAAAAGVEGEVGTTWPGGWGGIGARAGVGTGVVGTAGSTTLALRARQEARVHPQHTLRVDLQGSGGWWSEAAATPVDPRAWTQWSYDHPVWLALEGGWTSAPASDLRLDVAGRAVSNTGPSIDSVGGAVGGDLLVNRALILSASAGVKWRFVDEHRSEAGIWYDVRLGADWNMWTRREHRWRVRADIGVVQGAPVGTIGLALTDTGGRGLRDAPPGREIFRSARGPE